MLGKLEGWLLLETLIKIGLVLLAGLSPQTFAFSRINGCVPNLVLRIVFPTDTPFRSFLLHNVTSFLTNHKFARSNQRPKNLIRKLNHRNTVIVKSNTFPSLLQSLKQVNFSVIFLRVFNKFCYIVRALVSGHLLSELF